MFSNRNIYLSSPYPSTDPHQNFSPNWTVARSHIKNIGPTTMKLLTEVIDALITISVRHVISVTTDNIRSTLNI